LSDLGRFELGAGLFELRVTHQDRVDRTLHRDFLDGFDRHTAGE